MAEQSKPDPKDLEQVTGAAEKTAKKHPFRTGFIVGAIVTTAITLLIIQNGESVHVEWFVFDLQWPLWIILLLSFVGGMVGWQLFLFEIRRLRKVRSEGRTTAGKGRRARRTPRAGKGTR